MDCLLAAAFGIPVHASVEGMTAPLSAATDIITERHEGATYNLAPRPRFATYKRNQDEQRER
jgi:hypothetical protein